MAAKASAPACPQLAKADKAAGVLHPSSRLGPPHSRRQSDRGNTRPRLLPSAPLPTLPRGPGCAGLSSVKPKSLRSAPDGDVGPSRLALGPVAHRVDHGDPCDGCRGTDIRGDADT